ncbi:MAG: AAA family ATPase [Candidatus Methanoplasma sp.]|jgi:predicted AAA+ superfamily ATPase|nr:AAA family ATPase [Candidatus Methanoplasma sp.]
MLRRKVEADLLRWKRNPRRHPLLVRGARQVGKTFSIDRFARANYENYVYINFERDVSHREIFRGDLDVDTLIREISSRFIGKRLEPGSTVIVLDEIQSCPGARTSLKSFSEDGRFDVIATGSLLGVNFREVSSYPVGHEEYLDMYPLDFEEFLWALGAGDAAISRISRDLNAREPLDPHVLSAFEGYHSWHSIVGGMPEAVAEFVASNNFGNVLRIQRRIMAGYLADIAKYAEAPDKSRAQACLRSIPEQMGARFRYSDVESRKNAGARTYERGIDWIVDAGMAHRCRNVTEPSLPLEFNARYDAFKLYLRDTGLLVSMMEEDSIPELLKGNALVNGGRVAENLVAGEIGSKGIPLMYFEKKGRLEVDFVANIGGQVAAIEVKSGNNRQSKSLASVMSERYGVPRGIKLERTNVYVDDKGVEHYPLFAASFIFPDRSPFREASEVRRLPFPSDGDPGAG